MKVSRTKTNKSLQGKTSLSDAIIKYGDGHTIAYDRPYCITQISAVSSIAKLLDPEIENKEEVAITILNAVLDAGYKLGYDDGDYDGRTEMRRILLNL